MDWEIPDIAEMLDRREEQSTTVNVGVYPVPLGRPLRNFKVEPRASEPLRVPVETLRILGIL